MFNFLIKETLIPKEPLSQNIIVPENTKNQSANKTVMITLSTDTKNTGKISVVSIEKMEINVFLTEYRLNITILQGIQDRFSKDLKVYLLYF